MEENMEIQYQQKKSKQNKESIASNKQHYLILAILKLQQCI